MAPVVRLVQEAVQQVGGSDGFLDEVVRWEEEHPAAGYAAAFRAGHATGPEVVLPDGEAVVGVTGQEVVLLFTGGVASAGAATATWMFVLYQRAMADLRAAYVDLGVLDGD